MRAILTYHSIDDSRSPVSCHPEAFARHVDWLASGRVRVTTIDELMTLPDDADAVSVTFDDGFVNFGESAAPQLVDHGFPVTVFVVADLVGTTNSWDAGPSRSTPELPLLDWPALVRLQDQGVTLGAHTRTHPDLMAADDEALADELEGCAEQMEARCGRRPTVLAYPYGRRDKRAVRMAQRVFRWACTAEFQTLDKQSAAAELPRLDMYYFQQPGSLDDWGTAQFAARIRMRHGLRRMRTMAQAFLSRQGVKRR
jgi:peptidoglycan/xylan/chitin deacetylase (PgdA/CDA1 family)